MNEVRGADKAEIGMADHIAYHVPSPPDLEAESGRFGFELRRVRQILNELTPRSLTVLDDCLDGTTHEERLEILADVMVGLRYLGGTTLFSTHAHELVEAFDENKQRQFLQVEFGGEDPTYRIMPGIARTSHAVAVAKKNGLTRDQLEVEIRQKTGQEPQWL